MDNYILFQIAVLITGDMPEVGALDSAEVKKIVGKHAENARMELRSKAQAKAQTVEIKLRGNR